MLFNHAQLFPADYWAECRTALAGAPGWWEILDRQRPGTVVVEILDPIPPGRDKDVFFRELQDEIEEATARLVAEARAKP